MRELMGDSAQTTGNAYSGNNHGTVTFSNLVIGSQYTVQFLHHIDINNAAARSTTVYYGPDPYDASGGLVQAGDNQGYITTAIFTADTTSQAFYIDGRGAGGDRAALNAVSIQGPQKGTLIIIQ